MLPVRQGGDETSVPEPSERNPLPQYPCHIEAECGRWVERDLQRNLSHYHALDDTGEEEVPDHGMRTRHRQEHCWTVSPDDPASYRASSTFTCWMSRGEWRIRTVSTSSLRCDAFNYYISARVVAFEGEKEMSSRDWEQTIPRHYT